MISNILCPIWQYTHKGSTPHHPNPPVSTPPPPHSYPTTVQSPPHHRPSPQLLAVHGWPIFGADRYTYIPTLAIVPLFASVGTRVERAGGRRTVPVGSKTKGQGGSGAGGGSGGAVPPKDPKGAKGAKGPKRGPLMFPLISALGLALSIIALFGALAVQSTHGAQKWTHSRTLWTSAVAHGPEVRVLGFEF